LSDDPVQEGIRVLTICNACRYCEGFCAVFPAMERRLNFGEADLNYLANLCHHCAECYYACQYAPPHEFAVNIPKILAEVRVNSYYKYAWPRPLAAAFRRNGLVASLTLVLSLVISVLAARGWVSKSPGDFYQVIPHEVMVMIFGGVSIFILTALLAGLVRFWRESGERLSGFATPFAMKAGLSDVLTLRYLSGAGEGCTYPGEHRSLARWWLHHFTFYGFLLCFAATSVAAIYHYALGLRGPYGYLSLPVVLGTLGGFGLLAGTGGLYWLKQRQDAATADHRQHGMDSAFIALLFLTSLTGLLLLFLRETPVMGILLVTHVAAVMTLFLMLPYGKFVHGMYRLAALIRYSLERSSQQTGEAGHTNPQHPSIL
jgi:citrate/tricarballylate utilization protein